jgi:hypothetical protein
MTPDEARMRADRSFKQEERAREGRLAMTEYEAEARAIREKTARLRALRLARDAKAQVADQTANPKTERAPKRALSRS